MGRPMNAFDFVVADHLMPARDLVLNSGARVIAGGTSLLDLMKLGVEQPPCVVDIRGLPLGGISDLPSGGLRIGALISNTEVAYDERVRSGYPVLSEAILAGASPQLRNMATVGGNLLQRTRCTYFRDVAYACNKREPGSGCSAIGGVTRSHAVLGTSDACIAAHASDMCVALAALEATVVVEGAAGTKRIPFDDFYLLPGKTPACETILAPGDLIVALELAPSALARRSTYLKIRDRASYAFALVSVAAAIDIASDGSIGSARIALGGVGTKPWRAFAAEASLVGIVPSRDAFAAAAAIAFEDAQPQPDNAFKVTLGRRAIVRALEKLTRTP
jgi:xanthine dehydrogenase YagS FAD-binding subunit